MKPFARPSAVKLSASIFRNLARAVLCLALTSAANSKADSPAVHGMFVIPTQNSATPTKVYLSHLPMFMARHDYQVILEATLNEEGKQALLRYRQSHPTQTMYTIVPQPFVLPNLTRGMRSINAVLYQGHFERGGTPITRLMPINIQRVLYFAKFIPGAPRLPENNFLVFGSKQETYIAHLITTRPDHDQILKIAYQSPRTGDLVEQRGLIKIQVVGAPSSQPLRTSAVVSVHSNEMGFSDSVKIQQQLYYEVGDLSM